MGVASKLDVFDGIADPTRRKIISILAEKSQNIREITEQFPITRTAIVKHLKVLEDVELVKVETKGRAKVYQFNPKPLEEVKEWVEYYDKFWEDKLQNLANLFNK